MSMDSRNQRALFIADRFRIIKEHGRWLVPSERHSNKYSVVMEPNRTCSCPDFDLRQRDCKHILAVQHFIAGLTSTPSPQPPVESKQPRRTYRQNWPAYNLAQTAEKDHFQVLLRDLCSGIASPVRKTAGRPTLPLSDMVFSSAFKVYSTVSGRRFMSDLREAKERGFVSKTPHYNSVFNYLEMSELTPILQQMIVESSLPLKSVEDNFAADSTGFASSRFARWFEHRYGRMTAQHEWIKCHIMCGVKTNIVTAVEITMAADASTFEPLLQTTAKGFKVSEVSADKGYTSRKNIDLINAVGGTPFVAFKTSAVRTGNSKWAKAFDYFSYRRDEFLSHYHKRSNVESTFSMMKRKFGDGLRSRTETAMINETLCKVLCHNIVVLIHEICALKIEPVFWAKPQDAQEYLL